jgi:hypothetical protein
MGYSLTIDELDAASTAWIVKEAQQSGVSVETVVRRLIYRGLAVERKNVDRLPQHDLDALAGTWGIEETAEFLQATADFNQIDPALWQ